MFSSCILPSHPALTPVSWQPGPAHFPVTLLFLLFLHLPSFPLSPLFLQLSPEIADLLADDYRAILLSILIAH